MVCRNFSHCISREKISKLNRNYQFQSLCCHYHCSCSSLAFHWWHLAPLTKTQSWWVHPCHVYKAKNVLNDIAFRVPGVVTVECCTEVICPYSKDRSLQQVYFCNILFSMLFHHVIAHAFLLTLLWVASFDAMLLVESVQQPMSVVLMRLCQHQEFDFCKKHSNILHRVGLEIRLHKDRRSLSPDAKILLQTQT